MKSKKHIPVVLTVCAAAAVFVGCATDDNSKYDELNAKLDLNYSQIVLKVTNTYDDETVLTDEYTMKFVEGVVTINYSVERFAEVSLDSAATEKTTIEGKAVVMGGKITYVRGEEVPLDAVMAGTGLNFKKDYFANAELTDASLKADVITPDGFMGSSLSCSDMKVNASFGDAFSAITITYKAQSGQNVEYLYTFTV